MLSSVHPQSILKENSPAGAGAVNSPFGYSGLKLRVRQHSQVYRQQRAGAAVSQQQLGAARQGNARQMAVVTSREWPQLQGLHHSLVVLHEVWQ